MTLDGYRLLPTPEGQPHDPNASSPLPGGAEPPIVDVDLDENLDGNLFVAVSHVRGALAHRHGDDVAKRFFDEALAEGPDELLATLFRWSRPARKASATALRALDQYPS